MDTDSQVTLDRLYTKDANHYLNNPLFVFKNLNADSVINLGFNNGKIEISNTSKVTIVSKMQLGNIHLSGNNESSFIGFRWLNASNIDIENSNSITIGDFYTEQHDRIFDFSGENGDKKGRITIGGGQKIHAYNNIEPEYGVFDNYNGDIVFMQGNFVKTSNNKLSHEILLKQLEHGDNALNFILFGMGFTNYDSAAISPYSININKGSLDIKQSTVVVDGKGKKYDIQDQGNSNNTLLILQDSLSDLNELGKHDIKI
jgi:hypothetical protein